MNNALTTTTATLETFDQHQLTEEIASTVAEAEGTSILEIQPLAAVIDPDALSTVVLDHERETTVEFQYHGYLVRVSNGERLTVTLFDFDD